MTLDSKTQCQKEENKVKFYNREINKIEKMIDKFYLVYSVGPQETKLCNYGSGGTSE
jgi:hypothetical protein